MIATSKRFHLGTHRTCRPEDTCRRARAHLGKIGVTRIADVTRLDCLGIPVYQSVRPTSRTLAVSQGKGATPAAAWASAAMESIELWHAEDLRHVEQVSMSLREMAYDNPVPHDRLRWQVGTRALPAASIAWVRCRSLNRDRSGWLPRQMMELDFRLPDRFAPSMFHRTSNGLASGNCREEALLHGLCELIERHPLVSFDDDPDAWPAIDIETVADPPCRQMIDRIRSQEMKLALYDLTWDAGVPVVAAEFVAPDLPLVWRGYGCHTSPEVAASRALSEAAQSRLTYISGARDDVRYETVEGNPAYDLFRPPRPTRHLADLPDLSTPDVATDLENVLGRLTACGYEAFFVDLTRRDVGLPVVMAFIPGLQDPPDG